MARILDTFTLGNYARQFAVAWIGGFWPGWPERKRPWLMKEFWKFTYKDEFLYLIDAVRSHLTGADLDDFNAEVARLAQDEPRSDAVFHKLLADKLAIDPDGNHIPGKIGTVKHGGRVVGKVVNSKGQVKDAVWNTYAGEQEERDANSGVADPLPEPGTVFSQTSINEPVDRKE